MADLEMLRFDGRAVSKSAFILEFFGMA
jgi:hypothetical protein